MSSNWTTTPSAEIKYSNFELNSTICLNFQNSIKSKRSIPWLPYRKWLINPNGMCYDLISILTKFALCCLATKNNRLNLNFKWFLCISKCVSISMKIVWNSNSACSIFELFNSFFLSHRFSCFCFLFEFTFKIAHRK